MLGKIHNNLRDAISTSIPIKTLKGGIKEAQQKGPKGLPGPFGVFNNMPGPFGAKAIEANARKQAMSPKAKPKAQPKAQPKGKWVTNEYGIEVWHPPGYKKGQDPNEGWYFKEQIRNNAKTSPYRKNTWKPKGEYLY